MNDLNAQQTIMTYEDLLKERARLENLIVNQKNIIRHDFDELKLQFRKEIRPALEAANFVKKLTKPETRNATLVTTGAALVLDLALKTVFRKSNLLVQVLIPRIIKNYTSHFINHWRSISAPKSQVKN